MQRAERGEPEATEAGAEAEAEAEATERPRMGPWEQRLLPAEDSVQPTPISKLKLQDASALEGVSLEEHSVVCHERSRSRFAAVNEDLGYWVLVKGFDLSYYNQETMLFTIDPYYGNLN